MSSQIPCINQRAHGVQNHIAGTVAAIECSKMGTMTNSISGQVIVPTLAISNLSVSERAFYGKETDEDFNIRVRLIKTSRRLKTVQGKSIGPTLKSDAIDLEMESIITEARENGWTEEDIEAITLGPPPARDMITRDLNLNIGDTIKLPGDTSTFWGPRRLPAGTEAEVTGFTGKYGGGSKISVKGSDGIEFIVDIPLNKA